MGSTGYQPVPIGDSPLGTETAHSLSRTPVSTDDVSSRSAGPVARRNRQVAWATHSNFGIPDESARPTQFLRYILAVASALGFVNFVAAATVDTSQLPPAATRRVDFVRDIHPILAHACYSCHGADKQKGELRLDSKTAALKGGESGRAIVPGKSADSPLIHNVAGLNPDQVMPPRTSGGERLTAEQIGLLRAWIDQGADWPTGLETAQTKAGTSAWAFHPPVRPTPPKVKKSGWVRNPIDAFILAKLEARKLSPAPPADKQTLVRRATFDLTGLPPTPAEVDDFLADNSADAFAKVVERLLASPQYGERWGRHWLDVVRYTDSWDARGLGGAGDIADAWRYRDWVVAAFNRDLPFREFILNQIAGDLLPAEKPGDLNIPGTVATGFLAIGNWGNGDADKEKIITDIADDQVDVISRGFLGLTVACARCHDHKFDPITTKDYYGLAGIFFSTHILPAMAAKGAGESPLRIPLVSKAELEKRDRYTARVAELEKQFKAARDEHYQAFAKSQLSQSSRYMVAAWAYENRPADQAGLSLADFAMPRGLMEFALRRWAEFLGLSNDYRLMTAKLTDLLGNPGVHGWRGEGDTPNLLANTNEKELAILTFKLPPKSVSVHPGPTAGVAVGWKSPFTGTVKITGRVADGDPACGDGIAWILDHRRPGGTRELASGEIPNGGAQDFAKGRTPEKMQAVEVKAGELIQLLVLPKGGHACDTTTIELVIAPTDGAQVWNLTHDILPDPHQGNPHSDRQGHAGVWHFYDMANSNRAATPSAGGPDLTAWQHALAAGDRGGIEQAAQEFQKTFERVDATSPFWISNRADEKLLPPSAGAALAKIADELAMLKKNPPPPFNDFADGAQEGGVPGSAHAGVHDVAVHVRGHYDRLGEMVPRHFPVVLAGESQKPITEGSGRLQLAQWLASPENPLTARVMVNRIWQHHFGEGIVRTPNNYGKLGTPPTHPELLDYLAQWFVENGGSMKSLHRAILLSSTYQQSSRATPATQQVDPDNKLFGRMNRQRLEAEALRDTLLSVAGTLDRTLSGPSINDLNNRRRTVYLMTIRSDRSNYRALFDAADPNAIVEKRIDSTVAPQALFMLNHPFALAQTKALARRVTTAAPANDPGRINWLYRQLYGRSPNAPETNLGLKALELARAQSPATKETTANELAWEQYCQLLLCANEFMYVD